MIRTDYNDITNNIFLKSIVQLDDLVDKYIKDNFIHAFAAFYIANGYRLSAIWKENLTQILYEKMDSIILSDFVNDIDYNKLKEILETEYKIILTNIFPLEIIEAEKESAH